MDQINIMLSEMLTEREIIIFLLVNNLVADGTVSQRKLAAGLGISHTGLRDIYDRAAKKMERFASAGFFQTEVK